jgi:hypothetical protein
MILPLVYVRRGIWCASGSKLLLLYSRYQLFLCQNSPPVAKGRNAVQSSSSQVLNVADISNQGDCLAQKSQFPVSGSKDTVGSEVLYFAPPQVSEQGPDLSDTMLRSQQDAQPRNEQRNTARRDGCAMPSSLGRSMPSCQPRERVVKLWLERV